MQEMPGATEPAFSATTDDLFLPEDTPLEASRFFRSLIEIEIAFVMKSALKGPGILPVDVLRATDFVLPAIKCRRLNFTHAVIPPADTDW